MGEGAFIAPLFLQACEEENDGQEGNGVPEDKTPAKIDPWFDVSLAAYSLYRRFEAGKLSNEDFSAMAKEEFGIGAVEFLNSYFKDKAKEQAYLSALSSSSKKLGVDHLLTMVDEEGNLAEVSERKRKDAVLNHFKWVEAAAILGCHSIRVNARGIGSPALIREAAIDGLSRLGIFAADFNINILVENHGGYFSGGQWLASVMKLVDMENVGTLPDFGNFCIQGIPKGKGDCEIPYDRYQGLSQLMPFAGGVSAKTYAFDEDGEETTIDYGRMLVIVQASGYKGHVGIEYEGDQLSEIEGVKATKALLQRYRTRELETSPATSSQSDL